MYTSLYLYSGVCVCACVRACACVRVSVRVRVRACACACARACKQIACSYNVTLCTATVELIRIKAKAEGGVNVPCKAFERVAVIRAAAINAAAGISVPACSQVERVRQ